MSINLGYQTGTSTTSGPQWLQDAYKKLATNATDLASQSYQGWTGQNVADPSADTQSAWDTARSNVGNYQPYLDQASSALKQSSAPITSADVQTFMNPYQDSVTKGLTQNFSENVLPQLQDKFVSAGQSRSPQEAELTGRASRDLNTSIGQSLAGAYQGAMNSLLQQRSQQGQAASQYGQLASQASNLGQQDVNSLGSIGNAQDTRAQSNLDAQKQEFQSQKQYPYQQLQFLSSIYGGINPNVVGSSTNTSQGGISGMFSRGGSVRTPGYRGILKSLRG
jgi:hypothetical protein